MADALAYAHGQGVLHRDVKPANLLLDPTGTVWVTDFGLAKSADADDLTHAGDIVGTLRYMAPERFDGAGDARADVYALGLTLYELLTLQPAFGAENRAKLVQQVMDAHPPRPRAVNATIPRDLETIVLKATARDPGARYPTAAAMADDLRRFLDGRTITARRVGSAERLWRWAKRAPAVASLLVRTGVLLAAGTTVSTVFAFRADAQRKAADDARKDADARADDLKLEQERTAALLYASQAHQASTAAHEYRTARLLELLAATRPKPGKTDLRGWEWHYLDRLAHPWDAAAKLDFAAVPGFQADRAADVGFGGFGGFDGRGLTSGAAFAADGSRVVLPPMARFGWGGGPGGDAGARGAPTNSGGVFDGRTGKLVRATPPAAGVSISSIGMSATGAAPCWASPDARYLARAEAIRPPEASPPPDPGVRRAPPIGYRVRVADLEAGTDAPVPPFEVPGLPVTVAVAPGAARVVVVLDARSFKYPGSTFDLSPAPAAVQPGSRPKFGPTVVVWEPGGGVRTRALRHPDGEQDRLPLTGPWALSPDGSTAAQILVEAAPAGQPGGPLATARLVVHDLVGPAGPPRVLGSAPVLNSPTFSAGGTALAAWEGADGRTVRTFDVRAGREVGRWVIPAAVPMPADASPMTVTPLAVSDDGRRVATDGGGLLVVGEQVQGKPPVPPGGGDTERWRTAVVRRSGAQTLFGNVSSAQVWLAGDGSRVTALAADGALHTRPLYPFPGFDLTWPDELTVADVRCDPVVAARGRGVVYAPLNRGPVLRPDRTNPTETIARYDPVGRTVVGTATVSGPLGWRISLSPDGRRMVSTFAPVLVGPPQPERTARTAYQLVPLDRPQAAPLLDRSASNPNSTFSAVALSEGGRWVLDPESDRPPPAPLPGEGVWQNPDRYHLFSAETGAPAGTLPPGPHDWDGLAHAGPSHAPGDRLVLVLTYPKPTTTGPDHPPPVPATLRCYEAGGGREVWTWGLPEPIRFVRSQPYVRYQPVTPTVQFSPDGRRVAVVWVGEDGTSRVRLLGTDAGDDLGERTAPPAGGAGARPPLIPAVAFGPGDRLMVASDRDAVVWDGPGPGVRLGGHDQVVAAGVFSADGRRLFTLDGQLTNRLIHVWDLATRREVLTLREPATGGGGWMGLSYQGEEAMWLDGERLMLLTQGGVLVFDGTPREARP